MVTLPGMTQKAGTRMRDGGGQWTVPLDIESDYTFLGQHVTCVQDSIYPWPEAMVRRIRQERDPGFVPIFRRKFYRTRAGALLTFSHHGVARYDSASQSDRGLDSIPMPSRGYGSQFERPNIVERWFEGPMIRGSKRAKNNLPKPFVTWGDWVWKWVDETFWATAAAEKRRWHKEREDAEKGRSVAAAVAEAAYREKEEAPYRKQLFASLTASDEREAIGRQIGAIKPEPKVRVFHGGAG